MTDTNLEIRDDRGLRLLPNGRITCVCAVAFTGHDAERYQWFESDAWFRVRLTKVGNRAVETESELMEPKQIIGCNCCGEKYTMDEFTELLNPKIQSEKTYD